MSAGTEEKGPSSREFKRAPCKNPPGVKLKLPVEIKNCYNLELPPKHTHFPLWDCGKTRHDKGFLSGNLARWDTTKFSSVGLWQDETRQSISRNRSDPKFPVR